MNGFSIISSPATNPSNDMNCYATTLPIVMLLCSTIRDVAPTDVEPILKPHASRTRLQNSPNFSSFVRF